MTVRERALVDISEAIRSERPHYRLPEQLADELLNVTWPDIPDEELVSWIHLWGLVGAEISVARCQRRAQAYREMRKARQGTLFDTSPLPE